MSEQVIIKAPIGADSWPIIANCAKAEISRYHSLSLIGVLDPSLGLPPDESRVVTLDHRPIDIPGQALANEMRRCAVHSIGKRSFGQGLEGDRGHVE